VDISDSGELGYDFSQFLERETGEQVPYLGSNPNFDEFLTICSIDVFLDCITLIARRWLGKLGSNKAARWVTECERIFREEQAAYTVDTAGGVHPYVDAAFHSARHVAVAALQGDRYATAAASLAKAYDSLHGSPAQARDAVRHAFDATETLFKMMTGKARLTASDAKGTLAVVIDKQTSSNPLAQRASHQLLNSFADWVDACHHYRHAPGEAEPPAPPEPVWQLLMTQAAGFVRWLAQLDQGRSS
jgi:hypothetical protein